MKLNRQTLKKTLYGLAIGAVALGMTPSTRAVNPYSYRTCDNGTDKITWSEKCKGCARMKISPISFPNGSSFIGELIAAMDAWDNVERSGFYFIKDRDNDGKYGHNGVNEIVFDDIDGEGGALAVTWLTYNTRCWGALDDADIHEADVVFDVDEDWYTSSFDYNTSFIHFRTVALHELGHVLGLQDENDMMDTMNSFYPRGGPVGYNKQVIPLADARQGSRFLYPQAGIANADLVASNYKRTGFGRSGLVSGPTSAARGSNVSIEFTFMNIGSANSGSFTIGFYLSNNSYISTSDLLLAQGTATAGAGAVGTFKQTLHIPATITPGSYYLGVLLDKGGQVAERSEGNNNLAQPRTITIY